MKPQSPQQPSLPDPIAAQLQFDDEVTSVSIAGSTSSRSSYEDDVVDSGATSSGMASWNDPVQDERLDLLRKGSQDALAGARKRHMEKQARQRELIPFAEEDKDGNATSEPTPEPNQKPEPEEPLVPSADAGNTFPPDDFVEEETPAADEDEEPFEDEMVDEGFSPDQHRSPRLRKLLREPNNPKKNEAMRMSMPSEMRVTSNNPDNREQWNSVPTLNPGFDLPLSKPKEKPNSSPIKVAASAAPMASASYQPRPVSQARELVSEDRLRQERAQRQMVAPIVDEEARREDSLPRPKQRPHQQLNESQPQTQGTSDRPRLTEAPTNETGRLDRIKSSPLRGYHPAARKLTVPERERPETSQREPHQQAAERLPQQRAHRPSEHTHRYEAAPEPTLRSQPKRTPAPEPQAREAERPAQMQRQETAEFVQRREPEQRSPERRRPYIQLHDVNQPFEWEAIEISPEVPRCCGTCASFQPGGVDGRGSCTNRFAGPVQRVVDEQDLACQHTYGSLWVPADEEVWLEELQTDYPPTPRVDAMLARRRRRESTVLPDLDELTS